MDIVHPRVAGIDVHKKVVWVAVRLPGAAPGERTVVTRSFKTFWRSLQKMAAWLSGLGVTDAALESTGVYWWPVYHALAQAGIEVCVCNAGAHAQRPGCHPTRWMGTDGALGVRRGGHDGWGLRGGGGRRQGGHDGMGTARPAQVRCLTGRAADALGGARCQR